MSDKQDKKSTTSLEKWIVAGSVGVFFAAAVAVSYFDPFANQEDKFVSAAESGQIEQMDRALAKGADIEGWAGFNALSAASENGELEAVKHLVTLHDFSDDEIYRAAAEAARGGHNGVLEFYIAEGLDVNSDFVYGISVLEGAVWGNHQDTLDLLLQNNIDVTNPNTRPTRALGYALQEGYTEMVIKLLDAGMDVHTETYRGNVLSGAVLGGYRDIVDLAFERGADVAAENHDATRKAAEYGHSEILDLLIERGGSVQAANEGFAIRSARRGDIEGFKEILQKQPEVLQTVGGTLMSAASYHNKKNFIEMLIEEGVTSAEDLGSAVIFAAQDGYDDILEILLNQNADFKSLEYDALNEALHLATQNNNAGSVRLLLDHGADPRVRTSYAAPINMTNGKREIAKIFAEYLKQNSTTPAPSFP